jgi:NitT/TauT family transport system permease protein
MAKIVARVIGGVGSASQEAPVSAAQALRTTWLQHRIQTVSFRVFSVLLFIAAWAIFSALPWAIQIPSPLDALRSAAQLDPETFLTDVALSAYRVVLGFIVAAFIGVPLGIGIGYSPIIRDLVFPSIELFRPIPPIAWIPLAILFFPKIEWMIIFLTFYGAFFPIVYNTVAGVSGIRATYIQAGKSLGASEWTLFWHVVLPAALPVIFTGLYVAIGVAWLMVVAGEMIANKGGIGAMTWQAYQTTHYSRIFVGMAAIGIVGYLSSLLVSLISRVVIRWEQQ